MESYYGGTNSFHPLAFCKALTLLISTCWQWLTDWLSYCRHTSQVALLMRSNARRGFVRKLDLSTKTSYQQLPRAVRGQQDINARPLETSVDEVIPSQSRSVRYWTNEEMNKFFELTNGNESMPTDWWANLAEVGRRPRSRMSYKSYFSPTSILIVGN